MNVFTVTADKSIEFPPGQSLALVMGGGKPDFVGLDPGEPYQDLLLLRPDSHSVVMVASRGLLSITVNGRPVHAGICRVDNTAIVNIHGTASARFGILFTDAVLTVDPGVPCDICGQTLTEVGKGHCRKKYCRACIDVFGGTCPDCRRSLQDTGDAASHGSTLQEYLTQDIQ